MRDIVVNYSGTSPLRHPPFRGHKIWSRKNVHIIFVSVTSIERTHLFREEANFFWVPKPRFNLHSEDSLALKPQNRWYGQGFTSHNGDNFRTWTISIKIGVLHLWEFNTQYRKDKLIMIFYTLSSCFFGLCWYLIDIKIVWRVNKLN